MGGRLVLDRVAVVAPTKGGREVGASQERCPKEQPRTSGQVRPKIPHLVHRFRANLRVCKQRPWEAEA